MMRKAAAGALYETRWRFAHLFAVVGLMLGWLVLPPASYWFEVRSIAVEDAIEGISPRMHVDRTIHLPFRGSWILTVLRERRSGGFTFWCNAKGNNDYVPSAQLPENGDLAWWMDTQPCIRPLIAGRYVVRILWTVDPPLFPAKEIRRTSNVFEIKPASD